MIWHIFLRMGPKVKMHFLNFSDDISKKQKYLAGPKIEDVFNMSKIRASSFFSLLVPQRKVYFPFVPPNEKNAQRVEGKSKKKCGIGRCSLKLHI